MKELMRLLRDKDYVQAKCWMIDNSDKIDQIADLLITEVNNSELRCPVFGPVSDLEGNIKWECREKASQDVINKWKTTNSQ